MPLKQAPTARQRTLPLHRDAHLAQREGELLAARRPPALAPGRADITVVANVGGQQTACRVRVVPAEQIYSKAAAERLNLQNEYIHQCQNCNARVGCHKGTKRPLGSVANETLRLKRMETHHVFDGFWRRKGMTRTQAYRWLAEKLDLPVKRTHIGGFEMDQCQMTIDLCNVEEEKEAF